MDNCTKCHIELTKNNWPPSRRRKRYFLCNSCKNKQEVNRRQRLMQNEEKLYAVLKKKDYFCNKCSILLTKDNWNKSSAARRGYICITCHGISVNENRRKFKEEVLNIYGGRCVCCGETQTIFLTLDHINENGAKERKDFNSFGGTDFYYKLKKLGYPKDNYQVLCFNCNFAKHVLGRCPHES